MMFIVEGIVFICVAMLVVFLVIKAVTILQGDE